MKGCLACKHERRLSGISTMLCPVFKSEALSLIVIDLYWMARRYANGRQTIAVSMCNDAIKQAVRLGLPIKPDPINSKMYASDGDPNFNV